MKKIFLVIGIFILFHFNTGIVFAQNETQEVSKGAQATTDLEQQQKSDNPMENVYKPLAPLPGFTKIDSSFTLSSYIRTLVRVAIGIIGILAVIMIVISGVQYMGSDMFTEKESAKSRLQGAVTGLILAVSSVLILRTINPGLTNIDLEQNLVKNAGEITAEGISIPENLKIGGGGDYLISKGQGGNNPNVTKNITTYDTELKNASKEFGISCTVLKAHAYAESGMNPNAKSPVGAEGLIQIMPGTFKEANVGTNVFDPQTNTRASAKILAGLIKNPCPEKKAMSCVGGSYNRHTTAGYNTGRGGNGPSKDCPGKAKWECEINGAGYKETRNYVDRVWANIDVLNKNGWGC